MVHCHRVSRTTAAGSTRDSIKCSHSCARRKCMTCLKVQLKEVHSLTLRQRQVLSWCHGHCKMVCWSRQTVLLRRPRRWLPTWPHFWSGWQMKSMTSNTSRTICWCPAGLGCCWCCLDCGWLRLSSQPIISSERLNSNFAETILNTEHRVNGHLRKH